MASAPPVVSGSIADLVLARAREAPGAPALLALDGAPLGYAGLADRIARTGAELREAGIASGDRIALVLENGPELAAAFLGVASAAACAPLNPAYREPELAFYLSDLRAKALVLQGEGDSPARQVARSLGIPILELEGLALEGRVGPPSAEPARDDVALVLHTSGTTSRPKAVSLTHGNLLASAAAVASSLELSPNDRCLNVMPLFHIHGLVAAILASLHAGASVVCAPGFDGVRFLDWLADLEPTWYTAVPTMHEAVLERARSRPDAADRSRLRLIRSSSAPLPVPVLEGLERAFECPVIEAYGMTEAAHQMTSNPLPPAVRKPGSVGVAAGPEIAVLDGDGRVLPPGAAGEVAVRGPNVLVDGWYRTGDEGVLDEDGYLFLRGRLKEMVNRGGEKVSPREVDDVLLTHPDIAQAVTFAQADARLGENVAAAVVRRGGAALEEREVQEFVAERLADFKVPRTVVFLDELPKGATGKVQRVGLAERLGLPVLNAEPRAGRPPYVPPQTSLEERIAALWAELLEVEDVGRDDDFFALGGESLHAAELFAALETDLPGTTLLWASTVKTLAAALGGKHRLDLGRNLVPIEAAGSRAPVFLVHTHGGEALPFVRLVRRLAADHPFYAFARDEEVPEDVSVEGLAADYVEQVRAFQPEGPYFVVGVCFGAGVALEMARRLLAEGHEVSLLGLVLPIGEPRSRLRHYARRLRFYAEQRRVLWAFRRAARIHTRNLFTRVTPPADPVRDRFVRTMAGAGGRYVAKPYPGRLTVFRGPGYVTPDAFWERLAADGVDWYEIHQDANADVFDPRSVELLATRLDEALKASGRD